MKKLRLVLFDACNRNCPGCCNKDWNLPALPVCESFAGYDEILLTGGEPMLKPDLIISTVERIRLENKTAKIFVYTAKVDKIDAALAVLDVVDGITVTLHEQKDVVSFDNFDFWFINRKGKSLRLNVFKEVAIDLDIYKNRWIIKEIEWIENCPLPDGETLMRLSK